MDIFNLLYAFIFYWSIRVFEYLENHTCFSSIHCLHVFYCLFIFYRDNYFTYLFLQRIWCFLPRTYYIVHMGRFYYMGFKWSLLLHWDNTLLHVLSSTKTEFNTNRHIMSVGKLSGSFFRHESLGYKTCSLATIT